MMRIGRATVFMVGLAVILALVFGVATSAMGDNGDFFKVGRSNIASAVSTLDKSGAGPALRLLVDSGAPLTVNSTTKVANLNADRIDNREASSFANGVGGVATNADKLDNKDSTDFMTHNSTLKPGQTLVGVWGAAAPGTATGTELATETIEFRPKLAAAIPDTNVHFVTTSLDSTCPGQGQAAPGHLCVYQAASNSMDFHRFSRPSIGTSTTGADAEGTILLFETDAPNSNARGTWAVTAP